jgi:tetratricopeptide (TPR) repeat protein
MTATRTSTQIVIDLHRKQAEIKDLEMRDKIEEAKLLASRTVPVACKFGLYSVAVACYRFLHKYYSGINRNNEKAYKYFNKIHEYEDLESEHDEIREFNLRLQRKLDRKRGDMSRIVSLCERYLEISSNYKKMANHGPMFHYQHYMLECMYYGAKGDFESNLRCAEEAYNYYCAQSYSYNGYKHFFLTQIAEAYRSLRRNDDALKYLELSSQISTDRAVTLNNYLIIKSKIQLSMGLEIDIGEAQTTTLDQERVFDILEIYNGLVQGVELKMYEELSEYQKDPIGLGIALNVARLWQAHRKDAIDFHEEERIKKYMQRHDIDERSRLIFRFFVTGVDVRPELAKYDWNPDVEIIPYDVVVEIVLDNR